MMILTGLSTGNNVMTQLDSRETILLNGRGNCVTNQLDILQHGRMKACILILAYRLQADVSLLSNVQLGNPWEG
jgi:hypothetical protein